MDENNSEIRRVMLNRYRLSDQITGELSGEALWIQDIGLEPKCSNEYGTIYIKLFTDDEPLALIRVECPSTGRIYYLRFDPNAYHGVTKGQPQAAIASTWRYPDGSLLFDDWHDYTPVAQS